MEDQLLEKQLLKSINHIKNVSKKRVKADLLISHLKNIGAIDWDQELDFNNILCIVQCKRTTDVNFTLAENK